MYNFYILFLLLHKCQISEISTFTRIEISDPHVTVVDTISELHSQNTCRVSLFKLHLKSIVSFCVLFAHERRTSLSIKWRLSISRVKYTVNMNYSATCLQCASFILCNSSVYCNTISYHRTLRHIQIILRPLSLSLSLYGSTALRTLAVGLLGRGSAHIRAATFTQNNTNTE
jgi:hypothetical protein